MRVTADAGQSQRSTRLQVGDLRQGTARAQTVQSPLTRQSLACVIESEGRSARAREPWLIVASPQLQAPSAKQLVNVYARRMQIELAFRDLKSHRYGQALEDSLTRRGERLQILLLINTLAAFASWLAGLGCEATGIAQWLSPRNSTRKLYSTLRIGREALVRQWPMEPVSRWIGRLRALPAAVREQMTLTV
ncbi:transposase [Xanthomonas campestris]|uniref:transposase n=1 Tax=Xanthomonas campestris TaxID=339 RepID=UPI00235116FC|nr:transposase [Xanthomonas campestris]